MHRTLLETCPAAGAAVIVVAVAQPGSHLDHCILRAGAQAAITFAAVSAGQAALRLKRRRALRQPADNLLETSDPLFGLELGLLTAYGITEIPQTQHVERYAGMLGWDLRLRAAQPGVDLARGPLAVPHADRHGALS